MLSRSRAPPRGARSMSFRSLRPPLGAPLVLGALAAFPSSARGDFVKPNGPLPLAMPSTLGLAMETAESSTRPARARSYWGSCSAAAIRFPDVGVRLVTAKHCAGRRLEVFDETRTLSVRGRHDADGDIDVTLLDTRGDAPWSGLEIRAADTLVPGERLCAWKVERDGGAVVREQVCGRFLRRAQRENGPPLLIVRHPFPHGTSGSALADAKGRVVGIVVATQAETGIAEPIEAAAELVRAAR